MEHSTDLSQKMWVRSFFDLNPLSKHFYLEKLINDEYILCVVLIFLNMFICISHLQSQTCIYFTEASLKFQKDLSENQIGKF